MEYKDLLYEKKNGIAKITLNRPDSFNAFSYDMLKSWHLALLDADQDEDVRVILLTGAGKAFCAGGDIKSMRSGKGFLHGNTSDQELVALDYKKCLWEIIHRIPLTLESMEKPVIAAINGPAMGAGLDMALMCDIRIASEKAVLAESYINVGLVPGDGGAFFLPRLVGLAKALELLLTGDSIDANEALRIGLVNKVVPSAELEEKSWAMAQKIAQKSPQAARFIKRLIYQGLDSNLKTALDAVSSHMAIIACTEDHKEALTAFLEKRNPEFKNC